MEQRKLNIARHLLPPSNFVCGQTVLHVSLCVKMGNCKTIKRNCPSYKVKKCSVSRPPPLPSSWTGAAAVPSASDCAAAAAAAAAAIVAGAGWQRPR